MEANWNLFFEGLGVEVVAEENSVLENKCSFEQVDDILGLDDPYASGDNNLGAGTPWSCCKTMIAMATCGFAKRS